MIGGRRADDTGSLWELFNLGAPGATEWMRDGLCAQTDQDAFHPEKGASTRPAKSVCAVCPVREQCLSYALETNQQFGVWGGHSAKERRALRRGALWIGGPRDERANPVTS